MAWTIRKRLTNAYYWPSSNWSSLSSRESFILPIFCTSYSWRHRYTAHFLNSVGFFNSSDERNCVNAQEQSQLLENRVLVRQTNAMSVMSTSNHMTPRARALYFGLLWLGGLLALVQLEMKFQNDAWLIDLTRQFMSYSECYPVETLFNTSSVFHELFGNKRIGNNFNPQRTDIIGEVNQLTDLHKYVEIRNCNSR